MNMKLAVQQGCRDSFDFEPNQYSSETEFCLSFAGLVVETNELVG